MRPLTCNGFALTAISRNYDPANVPLMTAEASKRAIIPVFRHMRGCHRASATGPRRVGRRCWMACLEITSGSTRPLSLGQSPFPLSSFYPDRDLSVVLSDSSGAQHFRFCLESCLSFSLARLSCVSLSRILPAGPRFEINSVDDRNEPARRLRRGAQRHRCAAEEARL